MSIDKKRWKVILGEESTETLDEYLKRRQALYDSATSISKRVLKHKERYIRAWIAATGIDPRETECNFVEELHAPDENGVIRVIFYVEKYIDDEPVEPGDP